jgi:N-acetylglucosamine-6-sulfatase
MAATGLETRAARRGPGAALAGAVPVIALAAAVLAALASTVAPAAATPQTRPNVVVVTTDDQTQDSLRFMPNVRSLIVRRGASFPDSFVNFSLCCPSRSTFLTGQYAHNHGVLNNAPPDGGFDKLDSTNTLPVWLQNAGYYTGLIGKYLNGYADHRTDDPPPIPPGWTEWHGYMTNDQYYEYEVNENFFDGQLQPHGTLFTYDSAPEDYSTDSDTAKAVDFIQRRAPEAQPFFLWLTYEAPHAGGPEPSPQPPSDCNGTAIPAPRHATAFDTEPLPIPPNFNEADVSDKPDDIQSLPSLTSSDVSRIRRWYRCRLESLLAADEGVQRVVQTLRATGELANTLIVFDSDNGFFAGEHRIPRGKRTLYEESIRVPLAIRGPGVPRGVTARDMAINADLAPTILDATGVAPGLTEDGQSLLPFVRSPTVERGRALEIETPSFAAIRTHRYIYAEYGSGEKELYDLLNDPYELQSLHADPAYAGVMSRLAAELAPLRSCAGPSCLETPALHLDVSDRRRPDGCLRRPVHGVVAGEDLGGVDQVRFLVNGVFVSKDGSRPFERTLPYELLASRDVSHVRAVALLIDGRRMTIDRTIDACL